jgi:hypothetical protein
VDYDPCGWLGPDHSNSAGEPYKWEVVSNKSIYDFVTDGFELKAVAYDTSVLGRRADTPDCPLFPTEEYGLD